MSSTHVTAVKDFHCSDRRKGYASGFNTTTFILKHVDCLLILSNANVLLSGLTSTRK